MKKFFSFIAATSICCSAFAASQQTGWKGRVLDDRGEALPYANAILLSLPDSTVIAGTTTEEDGTFAISSDASKAVMMVSMIGYRTAYAYGPDCGTIRLELDSEMLGEASVTAFMPKTRLTDQGLETTVRGSVLETAGTANDALSKVPGMVSGQNGLEVLGKGAPLVYINGRKVIDSKELDRLQSNEIQSVEVVTNPGAQYNAAVRSVVRIKTIKHQGDGFGFNTGFSDEQSLRCEFNDPNGYLNMNFRHNGLDVFVEGNARKHSERQVSDIFQQTFGNPDFIQNGPLEYKDKMTNYGINGGFNWQIDDNNSLGARLETNMVPVMESTMYIDAMIYKGNELIDKLYSRADRHTDEMPYSVRANTYYNGTAGKLGIDFNADYYGMRISDGGITHEKSELASDDEVYVMSHGNSRMYAAKLVLSYPVWIGALQAGTEDVFSRRGDDYTIDSDKAPSSKSKSREDNLALFATYGLYLPKFGQLSAGLRYEHVLYDYDNLMGEDEPARKYNDFFPTVSYANAFGPVQMMLSYSSKTTRPDFSSLNGAMSYHSRYILQGGNPKLLPQKEHEAGFNLNWNFLTMVTQYSRVDRAITQWSELYNDEGIILVQPVNLDQPVRMLVWYLNASPTIGAWTMNYTAGVQQQWLNLDCPDPREASGQRTVSFSDKPMWIAMLNNSFRFKGGWQLELGGEYHSKAYLMNGYMENTFFNLTAAVQKSFLNDALVVRLSGNDLTGTANYNIFTDSGSHIIRQTNMMDSQRLVLSVRYNFNTAANKYKGTGAGSDTIQRMSK